MRYIPDSRNNLLSAVIAVSLCFLPPQTVRANEVTEEVIITSSRVPVPASRLGTSVSVVTSEEIEAHGNVSLVDILRQQPAISAAGNGGTGQTASMKIRGEEGFRTLFIVDGLRLLDAGSPQITGHVEHLLSNGVDRVEVLRGPQGLAFGADAGGVVNIRTRRLSSGVDASLNMQAGEYDTQLFSGHFGVSGDAGDVSLSVADFGTEGFNSRVDDTRLADNDGYENTTYHLRTGLDLSERVRLDAVHRNTKGGVQYDGCGFPTVHDCFSDFDQQASLGSLTLNGNELTHRLTFSQTHTRRGYFTEGVAGFSSESKLQRVEYLGTVGWLPGFDLVFGADHEKAQSGESERNNAGLFIEYLSDFSSRFFVTAGVRHDDNESFGRHTSARLTGAWLAELGSDWSMKVRSSYGTGFRAPSLYEIEYNSGAYAYPPASNVALTQETSEGHELGVEFENTTGLHLEAVYFSQQVKDAIEFDLTTFSGYLQDSGTSSSRGVELVGSLPVSQSLVLSGNYTYNDTERPDGTPRLRRPKQLLNLGVSWRGGAQRRLSVNTFARASRDAVDDGGPLDDYVVVDLTAAFQVTDHIRLSARVENLLDNQYSEVMNYNTAGRAVYMGFNLLFSR